MPVSSGIANPGSHSDPHRTAGSAIVISRPASPLRTRPPGTSTATSMSDEAMDFDVVRPRLLGAAARILGGAADAEDVVQDVWIRWQRTDRTGIRDRTAFLVTTTTRVALNVAMSARSRRELPIGDGILDCFCTTGDPAAAAAISEALELAVAQLLERLSATECAVFILREAFDYSFRGIAAVLGLTEPNARQVARRARTRLSGQRRCGVDPHEYGRLLEAFREAAGLGEMTRLEKVLAERVGRQLAA
jgi:RNA polymerase sigma-70 factor (ECF subfamily)